MSPTSSSVTLPTVTSSLAERDNGRMTVSAPTRSSWFSVGGWPSVLARDAARNARLADQGSQVGDDETRCAGGDLVEVEIAGGHRLEQHLQQRLAGGGVGQRQAQLPVAQVGGPQPGVELVGSRGGGDQRDALGGHGCAQLAQDQGGHRLGGGRQQGVDIGDQQHAAAVANLADRRRHGFEPVFGAQRANLRTVQLDQPAAVADRSHQRHLADAGGARHQHAEVGGGAQASSASAVRRAPA